MQRTRGAAGLRWDRRLGLGLIVAGMAALSIGPASGGAAAANRAAENAATNGFARASAAFVPFAVNPNIDFWPVYSMSESDGGLSHGVSAGFWPGFLVDATFFQFGYQPFERALFGAAESLYPNQPEDDQASSVDFAKMCAAGEVSPVLLPFDLGEGRAPEPLLTGCQSLYTQYREFIPYEVSSARTSSAHLRSSGIAKGARLAFGPVTIGKAAATSSTDATKGNEVVSVSTVLLSDVQIGTSLHIGTLKTSVRTVADGTRAGTTASHSLTVTDATVLDRAVKITDDGVQAPDGGAASEALAKEGIEVRLVAGDRRTTANAASAESGGLVVRMRRGPQEQFRFENDDRQSDGERGCDALADAQPGPVTGVEQDLGDNPLFDERPPYNQAPRRAGVDESVPPLIPCPLLLFDRSVDVGVVLGGATAASRYLQLPALSGLPGFGNEGFGGGGGGGTFPGTSAGGGSVPPMSPPGGGPELPGYGQVPPVPIDRILGTVNVGLGQDVAGRVQAIYAVMALLLGFALLGRRTFSRLTHQ